ncbi:MAG: hypothetical protein A2X49_14335 [Lentisphaerae bacterium GWF2_52_8]|nr:MAG: hypothetical protein A2X49_14335 [Lentisphaerae bacterium GWF2_52_8]
MGRGKPEKYFELSGKIRRLIQERQLKRNDILPSERQMAAMFEVNHLTLRKALRLLEREKIIYKEPSRGNYVGPRPSSGKGKKIVCMIFPDHEIFYYNILAELEEKLAAAGLHLLVHLTHNSRKKEEEILDFAMEEEMGAVVAMPNSECREKYRSMQVPLIFFDQFIEGLAAPHIISDDYNGGMMAAQHLLSLGHKAIAQIGSGYDQTMNSRAKGLVDALRKAGIKLPSSYVKTRDATRQWGYKAAEELFQLPNPPTAIFCGNDTIAAGAFKYCADHKISVPKQCSLMGFGNTSVSEDLDLSSVNQNVSMIASSLWKLLRLAMNGDTPPAETVIPTSLILRGSTTTKANAS